MRARRATAAAFLRGIDGSPPQDMPKRDLLVAVLRHAGQPLPHGHHADDERDGDDNFTPGDFLGGRAPPLDGAAAANAAGSSAAQSPSKQQRQQRTQLSAVKKRADGEQRIGGDGERDVSHFDRVAQQQRHKRAAAFLAGIDPTGGDLGAQSAADLMLVSTSLSCRNFFRGRRDEETTSTTSSDSDSETGETTTSSSSSDESDEYADGQPHTAKEISTKVRDGRVLPVKFRVGYQTLTVSTVVAHFGDARDYTDADSDGASDDGGQPLGVGDWLVGFASRGKGYDHHHGHRDTGAGTSGMGLRGGRRHREAYDRCFLPPKPGEPEVPERDPYWLDDPEIMSERRRKTLAYASYRCSIITHGDAAQVKDDIDAKFFVKHPQLEQRGLRLTAIRQIKVLLLSLAMEAGSPFDVAAVVHAVGYFESLVLRNHVGTGNRNLVAAVCMVLAVKFLETAVEGDSDKVTHLFDRLEDVFGYSRQQLLASEFAVLAKLEFDLVLPPRYAFTHLLRLLGLHNLSLVEHFASLQHHQQRLGAAGGGGVDPPDDAGVGRSTATPLEDARSVDV